MKIDPLIDRDYNVIYIKEEVSKVVKWLKEVKYLVPVDEKLLPMGIVSIDDTHKLVHGKIIDIDIARPIVTPDDTLIFVMELMQKNDLYYLPV